MSWIFQGQPLSELILRPVVRSEEARYQRQMAQYHYLGDLPKIGETLWYIATWREQWLAQMSVSAAALKCAARDRWIGWDFRLQYDRLKLIANNSRFLILPEGRWPTWVRGCSRCWRGGSSGIGSGTSDIRCCCSRRLSIHAASMAGCTVPQTGWNSV